MWCISVHPEICAALTSGCGGDDKIIQHSIFYSKDKT